MIDGHSIRYKSNSEPARDVKKGAHPCLVFCDRACPEIVEGGGILTSSLLPPHSKPTWHTMLHNSPWALYTSTKFSDGDIHVHNCDASHAGSAANQHRARPSF